MPKVNLQRSKFYDCFLFFSEATILRKKISPNSNTSVTFLLAGEECEEPNPKFNHKRITIVLVELKCESCFFGNLRRISTKGWRWMKSEKCLPFYGEVVKLNQIQVKWVRPFPRANVSEWGFERGKKDYFWSPSISVCMCEWVEKN